MIRNQPRLRISDIFAGLFFFIGFLLFIILLHIMAINAEGNTKDVLNTTFIVMLRIWETLLIFSGVGILIHLIRYMVWQTTTPHWVKEDMKRLK